MTPSGVEQLDADLAALWEQTVSRSVTPSGVEQMRVKADFQDQEM